MKVNSRLSRGRPAAWLGACLALALWSVQASAGLTVRVDAQPVTDPIDVFIDVTDTAGAPVGGLKATDFTVLVDGTTVASPTFSLPPSQDPNRHVSVVFAMDMSSSVQNGSLVDMQNAVIAFINAMQNGDYAAIVKFNNSNPSKASVVQPFTAIDHAAGTSALLSAVTAPYPGTGSNIRDGVALSIEQLKSPPTALPTGPKAVVLVSDGKDDASTTSLDTVLASAHAASVPVFTIGVGTPGTNGTKLLTDLATGTGAVYLPAPTPSQIASAYQTLLNQLNNEYLLSFTSSITDCNSHTLEARVTGQTAVTQTFQRCTAPPAPPPPAPTPGDNKGDSGGGGGGALGIAELGFCALLGLAAARRRRFGADRQH